MKEFTKYFLIILIVGFAALAYLVIKPFVAALIASAVVAYMFYPLYKWTNKKLIKNKMAASLVITILILIIFLVPVGLTVKALVSEITSTYGSLQEDNAGEKIILLDLDQNCTEETVVCQTINALNKNPQAKAIAVQVIDRGTRFIVESASKVLKAVTEAILQTFVAFFTIFFLFKDGKKIVEFTKDMLPLKAVHQTKVMTKLQEVTKAIIFGYIIIAIVQGIIAGIGYFLFGVKSPIFWAMITMIAALIPYMGTALVWLPIAIIMIISGLVNNTTDIIWKAVGLILYGIFVVGTVDNLIRPKLVGAKGKISPLIVLLGALGGLKMIGFLGFIIGPLILALFITIMQIYIEERKK